MKSPDEEKKGLLKLIPQVNELLEYILAHGIATDIPRGVLADITRDVLDDCRGAILSESEARPKPVELEIETLARKVGEEARQAMEPKMRKLINATGVVLHTNIGRSPLSGAAVDAIADVCQGYCNLEYRLDDGRRGSRQEHLEPLLRKLTGSQAGMVVNNNAAAILLVLTALARDKEVIVSRGELIEIGDSFRLPDIMNESGAKLVEVGTTNRTRLSDYANAIGPDTAILMKIHPSNYRIAGYSGGVTLRDLVKLGRTHYIPVVYDLGSGCLLDLEEIGLPGEPTASECISQGADIVTFSGDKLLGGPQAGLIVGSADFVDPLRKHPLARAVRVDKMTVAALEATLLDYLDPGDVWQRLPALRMLSEGEQAIKRRARRLERRLLGKGMEGIECHLVEETSRAGGGSLPTAEIPTYCVSISCSGVSAVALDKKLRTAKPPVIARVHDDKVLIDLRTVGDDEVPLIAEVMVRILS